MAHLFRSRSTVARRRHPRWPALVVALAVVACGGSGKDGNPGTSPTHAIRGTVSGAVSAGVTVTLSGAASATATTPSDGTYAFTGLADGSYTVRAARAGFTFSPATRSVTLTGADQAGQDFTATVAPTYTISGAVSGVVTSGVTVTLSGAASATTTTGGGGTYAFAGLADGGYTVTPSLAGYTFTPASRSVTLSGASQAAQDFTAAPTTYRIEGAVSGAVTSGVTVTLSGPANATTTSGGGGAYAFAGLANGSYTVTPSLAGYTFTPTARSVTLSGASQTAQDFTAAVSPAPPAPAAIAVAPADGGAVVSWTPSSGATGYNVYYGTTSALTTASPHVTTTSLSAAVSGLPNHQRRFFAVSAVGAGGEGALSAPRCGVPSPSSQTVRGASLDLHDPLCNDRLDLSRWATPGAFSAGVSGGKATLTLDDDNVEPRTLRNNYAHGTAGVNSAGGRVTTLSSLVQVPPATTAVAGGGEVRAAARLVYAPPQRRLSYPAAYRDFLLFEAGLAEVGQGLHAYRNVYHCDDASCIALGTSGLTMSDPGGFTAAANLASAPATYDTPYRVTVALNEATGVLRWTIQGGTEFEPAVSGTVDPTAYLDATAAWSTSPLAGQGFAGAQLAVRALSRSLVGGGSVKIAGLFDDVEVGINGGAPSLWDDFGGTGGNSGPVELSLAKWNAAGAPRVLPSGDGAFLLHGEATSTGTAQTLGYAITLPSPEAVDVLQADVSIPTFTSAGPGAASGSARVDGRFHNDGTGVVPGSAYGDVFAAVQVTDTGAGRTASWLVFKCANAACSGAPAVTQSGPIAAPTLSGVQALRVGYDRSVDEFVFGVGTTFLTVPAPAGTAFGAPARAPVKRVIALVSLPAQAGTKGTLDVRVNNVLTGSLRGGGGGGSGAFCSTLDPLAATTVEVQQIAAAPPTATGGTLVAGTYTLTGSQSYTGPGGATGGSGFTWRQLWTFSGDHVDLAIAYADGSVERHTGTYGVSGTTLTFIESCPSAGGVKQLEYSASGSDLALQDTGGPGQPGATSVYLLTRQ